MRISILTILFLASTHLLSQDSGVLESFNYKLCEGNSLQISARTGSGASLPVTFDWAHVTGLSDPQSIEVKPTVSSIYSVVITDNNKEVESQKHLVEIIGCDLTRKYASQEYMDHLKTENTDQLKSTVERKIYTSRVKEIRKDYSIPVIVHVLHQSEMDKTDRSLIEAQIVQLNRDFQSASYVKTPSATNDLKERFYSKSSMSIQFCMNSSDIHYYSGKISTWTDYNTLKDARLGIPPILPDQYLNIWISTLPDDISGYAQMPWGPSETDGIVIDSRYIGPNSSTSDYDGGHTLTHLVGNYLGLLPIWGRGDCTDDYVQDTPIQYAPSHHCLQEGQWLRSPCSPYLPVLFTNFMDNTLDECLSSFTEGQMHRMLSVLAPGGPRSGLSSCTPNVGLDQSQTE